MQQITHFLKSAADVSLNYGGDFMICKRARSVLNVTFMFTHM